MSDDHDLPGAVAFGSDNPAMQLPPRELPSGLAPQRVRQPDLGDSAEADHGGVLSVLAGPVAAAPTYRRSLFRR